ncbi:MAG: DUF3450 domain-containing protein [Myxococcales bacterium]|nr:DUF3450 domain-containing protein [Myxococcales bacterium]
MRRNTWGPDRSAKRALLGSAAALCAALALAPGGGSAQEDLDAELDRITKQNKAAAASQVAIQKLSSETSDLLDQYRNTQKRIEALNIYNAQLGTLLASQQGELDSLREQIDGITVVGRQITPLMLRMIDSLENFVGLDVPFLLEEREKRVKTLRELMGRADVEDSEKFRRLMEAYQIENEYGRTIEAYRGELREGQKKRTVDYLRIGRIVLIYVTLDGKEAARWDKASKGWKPLSREEMASMPSALRIARKQEAPSLIRLPVAGAELVKAETAK